MPQILCSALERETFPSLLPGHTRAFVPLSQAGPGTLCPSKQPDLPAQRLASWSSGLRFLLRSPQPHVLSIEESFSQWLRTCLQTAAQGFP